MVPVKGLSKLLYIYIIRYITNILKHASFSRSTKKRSLRGFIVRSFVLILRCLCWTISMYAGNLVQDADATETIGERMK